MRAVIKNMTLPNSGLFVKGYHHSRTFSRELEKVANSRTFSFADYSRYTVCYVFKGILINFNCFMHMLV